MIAQVRAFEPNTSPFEFVVIAHSMFVAGG
jgi:hypothetical protein